MEAKLGFSIPLNVFGSGLSIAHVGPIVVSPHARIGMNCRIHVGLKIGTRTGAPDEAQTIGDNVYIGPGPSSSAPLRSRIASPSGRKP